MHSAQLLVPHATIIAVDLFPTSGVVFVLWLLVYFCWCRNDVSEAAEVVECGSGGGGGAGGGSADGDDDTSTMYIDVYWLTKKQIFMILKHAIYCFYYYNNLSFSR